MITQDHVVGGGIGIAVATYLPQVITAQHWIGPDAPASAETGLILAIGACLVAAVRWFVNSRQPSVAVAAAPPQPPQPVPAAAAAIPAAPPAQPATAPPA